MSTLELRDLRIAYGNAEVVSGMNLTVSEGEFVSILGPSGSGKSSVLRAIGGYVAPADGQVIVGGRDITRLRPQARDVGMVFQDYVLFPHMTVRRNIEFGLRMRKVGKSERVNRTEEVLNLLKISELAERRPFQLSGGQQQRVALARSLVFQPRILLMDEPLGALDARLRTQMQLELRSLQKRTGVTTVFVTHDQEEAMIMSDRVVIMRDGMIVEEGDPEKLYREPHNRFAAEFLGTTNLIPVTSLREDGDRLIAQLEGIPGPVEVTGNGLRTGDAVSIRPECIDCSAAGSGSGSLRGVVRDRGFRGSHAILLVQVGKRTLLVRQDSRHRLDIGSEVDIAWQAADARLVRGD